MPDLDTIKKQAEAATDVLDDAAFDAHLYACRHSEEGSNQEFGRCEYQPCVRRRFALAIIAALERQLAEAQNGLRDIKEIVRRGGYLEIIPLCDRILKGG